MFDLVIFDCDGVLIDSETICIAVEAEILTRYGFAYSVEDVRRFTGLSSTSMYAAIEDEHGTPLPDDFHDHLVATLEDRFRRDLAAVPDIHLALDRLAIEACVASSSDPARLKYTLGLTLLYDRLAPNIYSATEVARGKPAPDLFLHAAERMGVPPKRCVVIEDSPFGVEAGRAAGMTVFGFTGGSHCLPGHGARLRAAGAEIVFDAMDDLDALLNPGESPGRQGRAVQA